MRAISLVVAVLAIVLLAAAPALARDATPEERDAIHRDVFAQIPLACLEQVQVSDADPAYAAVTLVADGGACHSENGGLVIVGAAAGGSWVEVADASQGLVCTAPGIAQIPSDLLPVPCSTPPRTRWYLPCGAGERVTLRQRPRQCDAGWDVSNAETWILRRLRWSRWGDGPATARGVSLPVHGYPGYEPRPVRVRAFRARPACGSSTPFYTRMRITYPAWTMRARPFGGGPWTYTPLPRQTRVVVTPFPSSCAV